MNATNGIGYAVHAHFATGWQQIGITHEHQLDALVDLHCRDDSMEELCCKEVLAIRVAA